MPTINHFELFPAHGLYREKAGLIHKFIFKIIPRSLYIQLQNELHFFKIRLNASRERRKYKKAQNIKVNIGAGNLGLSGWENIDAYKNKGITCVYDCRTSLPFPDNSVQMIFTEHFVEHLDYTEEIPFFLTECLRVLKPGGVLRVVVPDAGLYLRGYVENGWDTLTKIRPLKDGHIDNWFHCSYSNKMELINMIFRQGPEHKYSYDAEALEYVLKRFGFTKVIHQRYKESVLGTELAIDNEGRSSESLYMEAIKQ